MELFDPAWKGQPQQCSGRDERPGWAAHSRTLGPPVASPVLGSCLCVTGCDHEGTLG